MLYGTSFICNSHEVQLGIPCAQPGDYLKRLQKLLNQAFIRVTMCTDAQAFGSSPVVDAVVVAATGGLGVHPKSLFIHELASGVLVAGAATRTATWAGPLVATTLTSTRAPFCPDTSRRSSITRPLTLVRMSIVDVPCPLDTTVTLLDAYASPVRMTAPGPATLPPVDEVAITLAAIIAAIGSCGICVV